MWRLFVRNLLATSVLDGGSEAWLALQREDPNLALELGYQVGLYMALPTPSNSQCAV